MQPWSICVSVACAVKLCAHFNEVNVNILKPHKTKDSLPLNDTRTHTRSSHIQHNVHYTSHDSIRCLFAREFSTQKMSNPTQWFRSLSPSLAMFSSLFFHSLTLICSSSMLILTHRFYAQWLLQSMVMTCSFHIVYLRKSQEECTFRPIRQVFKMQCKRKNLFA